jgi:NhaP-type Na+/H+ or K+/H+ antiporter
MHIFGIVVLVILFSILGVGSVLILWYAIDSMIEDSKTQKERTIAWEKYYRAERIAIKEKQLGL